MSLNTFDYSEETNDGLLIDNGEDDLDGPKELSIGNISGMKSSIEKNIMELEDALTEIATQDESTEELIVELNLALEQSKLLLDKIVVIEDGYKRAITTDSLLSQDIVELAEQLGFIVPLHLTKELENLSEDGIQSDEQSPLKDQSNQSLDINDGDYKFVSFDELEKYLNEPLTSTEEHTPSPTKQESEIYEEVESQPSQVSHAQEESEPYTPDTSKEKELRKDYLKNSINLSRASFSSPTSTASFFSTPMVERSVGKKVEEDECIEDIPISSDEETPSMTEEQQQLIEEQDVDNLLEQLMIYTNGLEESTQSSPRNRQQSEAINDIKEDDNTNESVSSPSIFLKGDNRDTSPVYTRVTQRDLKPIITTPKNTPSLSPVKLEDDTLRRELEYSKNQLAKIKQENEFLQAKLNDKEMENEELKQSIENLSQTKINVDIEMQNIKEKEEKINLIASSLGDHIEFLQGMVEKLKNERDSKVIKQSEQLTSIIETLIRKENTLLQTVLSQMESEMKNRKVVLDEEMVKLKNLVLECLGEGDGNVSSKDTNAENYESLQAELQNIADELSEVNYFPSDPEDDIDIAVTRTLESLECPVSIEIERIGYGEYYLDRKLYIKLGPKGEPLVKNGNNFITLASYVKRLYAPFFTTEKYIKEEEQQDQEAQVLQSTKFESLLQKLSKTRDYIHNLSASQNRSSSPPASPPLKSSPLKNNNSLSVSQLNISNDSNTPKLSPREGPKVPQKKEEIQDQGKEGRPSSAPPNTRYINILQRAEKNKKLKPIKPTPQVRRPPPNSMQFDRRNSPLPPNYVMHNNNLLFVKQPSTNYEQVLAAHHAVKKPVLPRQQLAQPVSNNSRPSSPRNQPPVTNNPSSIFGSIDLSDPKQLAKLKKQALRMQIQQFSQKPIH